MHFLSDNPTHNHYDVHKFVMYLYVNLYKNIYTKIVSEIISNITFQFNIYNLFILQEKHNFNERHIYVYNKKKTEILQNIHNLH